MTGYETVLDIVAENPGIDTREFREAVADLDGDSDEAVELLDQAVSSKDVIRADGKHWIVRKGKYSFDSFDHEVAGSE